MISLVLKKKKKKKEFTKDFACFQLRLEDTPRIYTRLEIVVLKTGR